MGIQKICVCRCVCVYTYSDVNELGHPCYSCLKRVLKKLIIMP